MCAMVFWRNGKIHAIGMTACMETGMIHPCGVVASLKFSFTTDDMIWPNWMKVWTDETTAPLIDAGVISAWYVVAVFSARPTEMYTTTLPTTK